MQEEILQYHGNCSHSRGGGECTTLKALIKKTKSNKSKRYRKGEEKTYTKHKVYVLIEKNLKKVLKGRKKRKQDLRT